ncbi:MAG TPA: hypothetical protein VEF04_01725 [Blastocatellia bacterium]|nr:hypothetical protein [Blastocatellia bacterium]
MNHVTRSCFSNRRIVSALFFVTLMLTCAVAASAQKRPILGGYRAAEEKDKAEVDEAAEWAIGEQGRKQEMTITLVSIELAEVQLVAGRNFNLCMKVTLSAEGEDEETEQLVQAVVYRNLKREFSLTSWEEVESCIKKAPPSDGQEE